MDLPQSLQVFAIAVLKEQCNIPASGGSRAGTATLWHWVKDWATSLAPGLLASNQQSCAWMEVSQVGWSNVCLF